MRDVVFAALRCVGRALGNGLVTAGSCWYGGYGAYAAMQRTGLPSSQRPAPTDATVSRDAERGISEIEAYLAAHWAGPGVSEPPRRRGRARRSPPRIPES
ncbi:MAG: hypothetical protein ACRDWI_09105 [Jiangellaceae bacterium]